jgi:hypothetical protein
MIFLFKIFFNISYNYSIICGIKFFLSLMTSNVYYFVKSFHLITNKKLGAHWCQICWRLFFANLVSQKKNTYRTSLVELLYKRIHLRSRRSRRSHFFIHLCSINASPLQYKNGFHLELLLWSCVFKKVFDSVSKKIENPELKHLKELYQTDP